MAEKEGLHLQGKVNSRDIYEGKNGTSHTLDVSVLGMRSLIPVRVTKEIFENLKEGSLFSMSILVSQNKWGTSFSAV